MLKVSHVVFMSELPGIHPFSGLENHLMVLLPALSRHGADVELIVLTWNLGPEMQMRLAELEAAQVTVTILPCSRERPWHWLGFRRFDQAARLSEFLKERQDRIIHFHVDLLVTGLATWASGCQQIILSIHNDEPWLGKPGWRLWLRWLDRRVSRYIAISEQVQSHYARVAGISPDRLRIIYYGVPSDPLTSCPSELREEMQIPVDRFVVGFVGRLAPQKNVPLLLAAMRQLPDIHCVLVGDGPLRQELEALANEWKLANVQFLGRHPRAAELMPAFDLLCLPSIYEGLGLVLIEAMLRRVLIIGSRAGAIPEILGNGAYGLLFDSDDLTGLVQAIRSARQEPERMQEIRKQALAYAQRTFSVEAMAIQTIQVYEDAKIRAGLLSRRAAL
jgi:glycosyltransferase involved in cell wall biosynthesis